MDELSLPLKLKAEAEIALVEGDHMKAMDLYADAAEQALELGLNDLSNECAARSVEIIGLITEIDAFDLSDSLAPSEHIASDR